MNLIYLLCIILAITILVSLTMTHVKLSRFAGQIALIAPVLALVYFLWQIPRVVEGQMTRVNMPWLQAIDIDLAFRLDGLSLLFGILISGIGVAVFYYATQYLSKEHDHLPRFYIYLLLFMFSMIGVVTSNNTILLYVFWELTSVSSFLLISYWYDKEDSQYGAIQSFVITVLGGLALLVGFVMIYSITGTNTITDIL